MDSPDRPIEIFAPFSEAFELPRKTLFQLIVMLCGLFVGGGVAVLFVLRWYWGTALFPFPILILLGVLFALIAILISLVLRFMVPVMYRRRCEAMEAFRDVLALVSAYP